MKRIHNNNTWIQWDAFHRIFPYFNWLGAGWDVWASLAYRHEKLNQNFKFILMYECERVSYSRLRSLLRLGCCCLTFTWTNDDTMCSALWKPILNHCVNEQRPLSAIETKCGVWIFNCSSVELGRPALSHSFFLLKETRLNLITIEGSNWAGSLMHILNGCVSQVNQIKSSNHIACIFHFQFLCWRRWRRRGERISIQVFSFACYVHRILTFKNQIWIHFFFCESRNNSNWINSYILFWILVSGLQSAEHEPNRSTKTHKSFVWKQF